MNAYQSVFDILNPVQQELDATLWPNLTRDIELLETNLQEARREGRNLRIAIVGQMKAGKSSFLNAAFFGFDLLPKADTPMTAALTRIAYAEQPSAVVEFYSTDDWNGIKAKADEYLTQYKRVQQQLREESLEQSSPFARTASAVMEPSHEAINAQISEDLRAANEVVQQASQSGLRLEDYLGTRQVLSDIGSAREIAKALQNYVGVGGRFTPITKMTELYVDDARFKDIEVYDTPGFNDPVVSRGNATRSFLGQCDVVFLLSTLSQFFARSDLELVRAQLSAAGISNQAITLVGTQRDVALRQDQKIASLAREMVKQMPDAERPAATVAAMLFVLSERMKKHVHSTLDEHLKNPRIDEASQAILETLRKNDPVFISSWCWLLAENFANLNSDDREQLAALCRDTGYEFNEFTLRELSNIPTLRQQVVEQRQHKAKRLAEKERNLIEGSKVNVQNKLAELKTMLEKDVEKIASGNIARLQEQKQETEQRIRNGRSGLETVFNTAINGVRQAFGKLENEIHSISGQYNTIKSQKSTHTESYEVSISKWYKPWTWGDTKTCYREVVTVYADAQDAIDNLNRYANETQRKLQNTIQDVINLRELRQKVSQAAMSLFDTGSANFDFEDLRSQIDLSLSKVTVPKVDFGKKNYSQTIVSRFGGGRVSESDIDGLRRAQQDALASIMSDLETKAREMMKTLTDSLDRTGDTFVDSLISDLTMKADELTAAIKNKEISLKNKHAAIEAVGKTLAACTTV